MKQIFFLSEVFNDIHEVTFNPVGLPVVDRFLKGIFLQEQYE